MTGALSKEKRGDEAGACLYDRQIMTRFDNTTGHLAIVSPIIHVLRCNFEIGRNFKLKITTSFEITTFNLTCNCVLVPG